MMRRPSPDVNQFMMHVLTCHQSLTRTRVLHLADEVFLVSKVGMHVIIRDQVAKSTGII